MTPVTRTELEWIIETEKSFSSYIEGAESSPDVATLELIAQAYEMDGDAWDDYELLRFIEDTCARFRAYLDRHAVNS
jgi:hypothetical protein